jgi:hypothetical protein
MRELPADFRSSPEPQLTRVTCPDCSGALTVSAEGRQFVHFACRVGHVYSVKDVLAAKEEQLENRVWSAVVACEEVAGLLEVFQGGPEGPFAERIRQARDDAETLRRLLDRGMSLDLGRIDLSGRVAPE